ncbi:MAG: methyltransferase domain-containing protein, partial [Oscillospiraceae bacterium]
NRQAAERLYAVAAEFADLRKTETLLDLYCGAGTIGLSMAGRVRSLIGVEIIPDAVQNAIENAARNGISNARFLCADAAEAALGLEREGIRPDVVVLDPPRKGCEASLLETVARMAPSRVVMVSCDSATAARDVARFGALGYRLVRAQAVDMFPRTAHVESVILLVKLPSEDIK